MAKTQKQQVSKITKMLIADSKQKVSKVRNQYGIVQNMGEYLKHLDGRKIRIVKGFNPDLLYGVIQHAGYEGLVLAFNTNEVNLI
jgi:hypothetical protein